MILYYSFKNPKCLMEKFDDTVFKYRLLSIYCPFCYSAFGNNDVANIFSITKLENLERDVKTGEAVASETVVRSMEITVIREM